MHRNIESETSLKRYKNYVSMCLKKQELNFIRSETQNC